MRYKLPRPKGLPDSEELALLEAEVEEHGVVLGGDWEVGLDRKKILGDLLKLGTAYHFQGRDDDAIRVLEEVVGKQGKFGAFQFLAVSYERIGRYEEAIATHRRAIERDPTSTFHLGHLGRLLCLVGREVDAEKALKAAQKAAPYDFHVRARLASVRSRMTPEDFNEAARRPTYSIIVLLGDRANFSTYQTVLEGLYRRTHRLILVSDADSKEEGDEGFAIKTWIRRHPGVEFTDHSVVHRSRVGWLSRLTDRSYSSGTGWPWIQPTSERLRGWMLKMAADLLVVCVDRSDPYFVEPYVQAADDAGYLVCGLSESGTVTPLERYLSPAAPRLRCVSESAPDFRLGLAQTGNSAIVRGDLRLESAFRPKPEKREVRRFNEILPTLEERPFVLYMADPKSDPSREFLRAGSLAGRLRQSNRVGLRDLTVVYRSAVPARLPTLHPMPDNLVLWPRPTASQDANTAAVLRVGIRRALAVVSHGANEVTPGLLAERPAIVLGTEGESVRVDTPYATGVYACNSLGEAVGLLGDLLDGCDPLGPARRELAEAGDPSVESKFNSFGAVLAHGVELLAGGESLDRTTRLLRSEFGGSTRAHLIGGDVSASTGPALRWVEAADQALAAAGSDLRVAPAYRDSPTLVDPELKGDLDAASQVVRGLESSRLIEQIIGRSSLGLAAQLLGGTDFPEAQLQSALLLKATCPDATIYLVDFDDRFEEIERGVRAVFPDAEIANAVSGSMSGKARLFDFVYVLDKHVGRFMAYAPPVAIAQTELCMVPRDRVLLLASRLQEWSVSYLMLSIDTDHPWSARYPGLSAALRRSFRVAEVGGEDPGRYQAVVAVSQPAVMALQRGTASPELLPSELKRPSVSIGLVVYNGGENLREAIESILTQTYWDFELIVVDNGSIDSTLEIARAYADRDPRIIIYPRSKNVGAVGNFRFSLSLATGTYFCWASDHDLYDRVWLERMIHALEGRPGAILAYPYFGMIDDRGVRVGDHLVRFDTTGRDVAHRMRLVTDRMRGSGSKVYGLYRRAALEKVPVRTTVWWDRLFLLELAAIGDFVQVNEVLWWRRYKGIHRHQIEAPEPGKFGSIPPGLSTKDTVIRQLKISFEDGRPPFLMRMATLANAVLLVVDLVFRRQGRPGVDLGMLPLALRSAFRAVVRTKSFLPAEAQALREHLFGR